MLPAEPLSHTDTCLPTWLLLSHTAPITPPLVPAGLVFECEEGPLPRVGP